MGVQLTVTPDSRWEMEVADLVAATRDAGFVGLGSHVDRAGPETRALFDAAGLQCHEIMALVINDDVDRCLAYAERLAAAASAMAAPWVNTVFRSPPTGEAAVLITRCARMFADAGSAMAVEFSPLGAVPTLSDGLEVVEIAGSGAALLIDTWHFTFGASTWDDLGSVPADKIAYVQFSDAPALESTDLISETMNRRVLPGRGIIDLDRFATTLLASGFDGCVSLELLNREIQAADVPHHLCRAFDTMRRYWS